MAEAVNFIGLDSQPVSTDTIRIYERGTLDLLTGITDRAGGPLTNPFTVADAGVVDDWGFIPPPAEYDIYWVEGARNLGQALGSPNDNSKESLSTGHVSGLLLKINADDTLFDIESGYYKITIYSDLVNPPVTCIEYAGIEGVAPEFLLTHNASYIALDINGNVVQSSTPFTPTQRRSLDTVGAAIHSNNVNINVVNQIKAPVVASTNQLHDLIKAIGSLNLNGNLYSNNGVDLKIDRTAGIIWGLGINADDYTNPHSLALAEDIALTCRYRLQNGTEYANTQYVDPDNYDNGGVLTAVGINKFTIQHINMFQSGITRIQYGQTIYNTIESARAAVSTESFITEGNISDNAIFRSYLILRQGEINLDTAITNGTAEFVPVDKFGGAVGGITVLPVDVSLLEAEVGTETANRSWSPLRVRQAIEAWGITITSIFSGILKAVTSSEKTDYDATSGGTIDIDFTENDITIVADTTPFVINKGTGWPATGKACGQTCTIEGIGPFSFSFTGFTPVKNPSSVPDGSDVTTFLESRIKFQNGGFSIKKVGGE